MLHLNTIMRQKPEYRPPSPEQQPEQTISDLLVHWESRRVINALTHSILAIAQWAHAQQQSSILKASLADQASKVTQLLLNQKLQEQCKILVEFCNNFLKHLEELDLHNPVETAITLETALARLRTFPFALSFVIEDGIGSEQEFLEMIQLMGKYTDQCYEAIILVDQLDKKSISTELRVRYISLKRQLVTLLTSADTNNDALITHTVLGIIVLADVIIPGFRTPVSKGDTIQA